MRHLSILAPALTTLHICALAHTTPKPVTSVRPEWIDPIRFCQYDANKDGKLNLQEQETTRGGFRLIIEQNKDRRAKVSKPSI